MSEKSGSLAHKSASDYQLLIGRLSGDPEAVEREERRGQLSLGSGKVLPIECNRFNGPDVRETLAAWGVKFLGPIEGDALFERVELPIGWKIVMGNEFWSSLCDDKGRCRASVFYKAVSFDRRAHVVLCRRYGAVVDSTAFYEQKKLVARVYDGTEVIHEIVGEAFTREYMKSDEGWADANVKREKLEKEIIDWLAARYPNYTNEGAYWE